MLVWAKAEVFRVAASKEPHPWGGRETFVSGAQGINSELKRMIEAIFEDVGVQCLAAFSGK